MFADLKRLHTVDGTGGLPPVPRRFMMEPMRKFLLLSWMLAGLLVSDGAWAESAKVKFEWTEAKAPVRGVALLIHGLNLKPSKMDQLGHVLASSGVEVLRVELSGHRAGRAIEEFVQVDASKWVDEATEAYRLCEARAERHRVPLHFVGFSLGGLLGQELLARQRDFSRMVLFAPAIEVRAMVHLVRPLFLLGRDFILKSRNNPDYTANRGTPMAGYRALFDLIEDVSDHAFKRANIPTLVIIDPEDEVVSLSGLQQIKESRALTNWRFFPVSNARSTLPGKQHHLVIDEIAVGSEEWARITQAVLEHLSEVKP